MDAPEEAYSPPRRPPKGHNPGWPTWLLGLPTALLATATLIAAFLSQNRVLIASLGLALWAFVLVAGIILASIREQQSLSPRYGIYSAFLLGFAAAVPLTLLFLVPLGASVATLGSAVQTPVSPTTHISPSPPGATLTPTAHAEISFPRNDSFVRQSETITGRLFDLASNEAAFLLIGSYELGEIYYPQAMIDPKEDGSWAIPVIFGSQNYPYELFVVVASNANSITILQNTSARHLAIQSLPDGTRRLGNSATVTWPSFTATP